jgi:hypothetical protein
MSSTNYTPASLFKICAKCHQEKSSSQFKLNPKLKDGLSCYCIKCIQENGKERYKNNRSKMITQTMAWQKQNPHYLIESKKKYESKYPLVRFRKYIQRVTKEKFGFSASLGITIKEGTKYFESKFQPGMTWENYGKIWHFIRIKPIEQFIPHNLKEVNFYINFIPMFK